MLRAAFPMISGEPLKRDALGQADWLVETRLSPSRLRDDLLARSRLLQALELAIAVHPLTLLSAPAGYGKTTLLSAIANRELPIAIRAAWLSLEDADNDPARFLAGLIAALQCRAPGCGGAAQVLLADLPNPGAEARRIIATLISDLLAAFPDPFALILDDLHLITEPAVFVALDYLLERAPPSLRLIIGTRHDPPLALARLRARGQLAELRAADLRFTPEETACFFNERLNLGLAESDLATLHGRTEGWPAGLRLLAGSLERIPAPADRTAFMRDLAHTDRYIFDFLADEVLNRQPAHVRAFLLETSILAELTPARCRAVTGREDAPAILEDLYRRNLFITAAPTPPSTNLPTYQSTNLPIYRYHALFAEFLRQRLAQEASERVRELHRRAAETQTDPARGLRHYLAAEMWEEAAALIEQVGAGAVEQGLLATVTGWINALPAPVRAAHPRLIYLLGVCAWQRGEPLAAIDLLGDALRRCEAAGDEAGQISALTDLVPPLVMSARYGRVHEVSQHALAQRIGPASRVQLLMVRGIAEVTQDECQQAKVHLEQALAITEAANTPDAWAAQMIHCVSQFTVLPGAIDLVERICQQTTRCFPEQATTAGIAAAARHALVHLLRGRPGEALASAERALALGEQLGRISYLGGEAAWALAQTHLALGDYAAAAHALDQAHAFFLQFPHGEAAVTTLFYLRGVMAYHQGQTAELHRWLGQMETTRIPGEWTVVEALRGLLRGIAAIAEGRDRDAERLLRPVAEHQAQVCTSIRFGSAAAWLAHLRLRHGRPAEVLAGYADLMAECQRQGMPGRLLLEGAAAVPLLQLALARGIQPTLAASMLEALGLAPDLRPVPVPATGEILTAREVEILRLLAAGASNRTIAGQLHTTEGTVKSHLHHIFRKLDVASRTAAVARARELRLV